MQGSPLKPQKQSVSLTYSELPQTEGSFSFDNFEQYIISPKASENFPLLKQLIKVSQLYKLEIRFNIWRLLLGVFLPQDSMEQKIEQLQKTRQTYAELVEKYLNTNNASLTKSNKQEGAVVKKVVNNPLGVKSPLGPPGGGSLLSGTTVSNNEDLELKNEIQKDVQRTYQEYQLFQNKKIQGILTNLLFIWSKMYPIISYRQGINEVIAPLLLIYYKQIQFIEDEQNSSNANPDLVQQARVFMNIENLEADVYALFHLIMQQGQMEMFRHRDDDSKNKRTDINVNSQKGTVLLQRISKIQDHLLKVVDIELFKHLRLMNVQFQSFLSRWIKCMHTREFSFFDSMKLWDVIFLESMQAIDPAESFFFLDCTCMAMIRYVRSQIIIGQDMTDCMSALQKFPSTADIKFIIKIAYRNKGLLQNPSGEQEINENNEITNEISVDYKSRVPLSAQVKAPSGLLNSGFTEKQKENQNNLKGADTAKVPVVPSLSEAMPTNNLISNEKEKPKTIQVEEKQKQIYTTKILSQKEPIVQESAKQTNTNQTEEYLKSPINVSRKQSQLILDLLNSSIGMLQAQRETENIKAVIQGLQNIHDALEGKIKLPINKDPLQK